MTKEELFRLRGQLTWEIEVAQAKLHAVNQQLVKLFNDAAKPPMEPEKKEGE